MASKDGQDPRIARIKSAIRVIPNFPKQGNMFQDITTLLLDTKAFKDTIDLFVERYIDKNITVVAGLEAKGFIFGSPIALALGAKFVPMRKHNKLPGAVQPGARAIVIDDQIVTGGSLYAAFKLLERAGVHVVECACVIEFPELKGREKLGDKSLFALINAS
ncbi:adenine phosphoribosyltransferase 1, chloroplastic-like [Gastrolobium bilobum]|uniref:adenine phosphoribosyltransferase 1, chloroplastic-like n=1 Tax=Gastrolobium bilobum TaxID=150636 RepID=UPI002AB0EFDF|nr:adenine phosphoribosyltransferase 1, chloroplastic-like [Gastrolobium bilobum]